MTTNTWTIDGSHTHAHFSVRHLMISNVRGEFRTISGKATFSPDAPEASSVEAEVDVMSIHTREEKRDEHLRSADFFDAANFPKITFKSTRVQRTSDGVSLVGDLTIRGATKSVTFEVEGPTSFQTDPWGNVRVGASATSKIKRSDFGITWNAALEAGGVVVGDEIKIQLDVELIQDKALPMKTFLSAAVLLLSASVLSVGLLGCDDANKGKAKATTGEAAAPVAAATNASAYAFDGTSSKVSFVGSKAIGKHDGGFATFSGTVKIPGTDIEKGTVSASIDTGSVTADDAKLTGHLKSKDFFDVEKFPKATFESTGVKKAGEVYTVTGNLTLHGVTKSISFPAKIAVAGDTATVDADFTINRKDFGIVYAGQADNLIKDDVNLKLAIKAKKS